MTIATRRAWDGGFAFDFDTSGGDVDPAYVAPPVPLGERTVVALAVNSVMMFDTEATPDVSIESAPYARFRVLVGGKDVTYFRGCQTPMPSFELLEPFLYGSGSITFPQIHAAYERPGHGTLSWLKKFATVRIQRVDADGTVLSTDYVGFIADFQHQGRSLTCTLGGEATGRAAMTDREPRPFPRQNDIGTQVMLTVRSQLRLPIVNIPDTGINILDPGGTGSQLDFLTETLAKSTMRGGAQWTVMPNASGKYRMFRKDVETVAASVYIDGYGVVEDLRRDFTEEPNRIWVSAVGPDGKRIRFAVYPGYTSTQRPSFPGTLSPGDSGDGVTAMKWRLYQAGYFDDPPDDWTTDDDDPITAAVEDVQQNAGLTVNGVVDLATWKAIFTADDTGRSPRGSRVLPAAQADYTFQKLRNANGQTIGLNPKYVRSALLVDATYDMGQVPDIRHARRWAREKMVDGSTENWVGTVTVNTGAVIDGTHNPGDPLTSDLVRDARSIKPGMNLWLPTWGGTADDPGVLVHVSGVSVSEGSVQFAVDTRNRDAMEVWEIIARHKESRNTVNRAWDIRQRRSGMRDDTGAFYDGSFFGRVADTPVAGGTWNAVTTAGGRMGILNLIDCLLLDPTEYAFAVWDRERDAEWINRRIGDPRRDGFENFYNTHADALHDQGLIDHWGMHPASGPDQFCGYGLGGHVLSDGSNSDAPLTGKFRFAAGTPYRCHQGTMTIAVYPFDDTVLQGGRILDLLLDDGAS